MDLQGCKNVFSQKTKGVKIWSKAIYKETENLHLYFIDVQGFDQDLTFQNFIWMFSFLLGTIVIYSTQGDINDQTWADLSSFECISKQLVISENAMENDYLLSYYAPKLIWMVKDFALPDQDGKPIPADKYLEN